MTIKIVRPPLNEIYFDTIDTEKNAYFLGLMFADGYVSRDMRKINSWKSGINLQEKDKYILEEFSKEIYGEVIYLSHKRAYIGKNNKTGKTWNANGSYTLEIGNFHLAQTLIKHGCTPRKGLTL